MKKLLTIIAITVQLFIFNPLFSAVYEASTLHNSVSRSETVQDLFMKRWDILQDKNFYFDIYGKINWVFDFDVNTVNAGTGKTESTELRLVRTYGSMTVALPITGFREKAEDHDFILALTTTGFHYGLTKSIEVGRGSAGSESVTDYKHSQFFDDIYAFSLLYRDYFTFHGGMIFNKEYAPKNDGTMDYTDPVKSYSKLFYAIGVMKFMAFSMNIDEGKPQSTKTEIKINELLSHIKDVSNKYYPVFSIGYERTMAYNDELYDSVWVDTATGKGSSSTYVKDSATLNVLSTRVVQRISDFFTIEGFYGAQYINKDIYSKTTGNKINVAKSKEWNILINLDPVTPPENTKYKVYTGMSWYWDPAIAIHRDKPSKGNAVYGWILAAEADFVNYGGDLKTQYNYSTELKKLMEASDKWSVEGSLFFRI